MSDLENQGWVLLSDLFEDGFLDLLKDQFLHKLKEDVFSKAKVGKQNLRSLRDNIRRSKICWIEDWEESSEVEFLFDFLNHLMVELNQHFLLSMKRFESQFAYYPMGGFYKKHLDQLKGGMHRQLTSIIYLNDCDKGGELVIFNRENKRVIDLTYSPKRGDMVLFFSSQIFHEVLPTQAPRLSLTSWLRDDLYIF